MPRRSARIVTILTTASLGLTLAVIPAGASRAVPRLAGATVVDNLALPWDVTWVGDRLLYTLNRGEVWAKRGTASPLRVLNLVSSTSDNNEGGLLGIVADPAAATNGRFYTCGVYEDAGGPEDVRIRRWRITPDTSAVSEGTVLAGMPLTSGRHSGCRLRFGTDGKLYAGTGDAAVGTNPQNLNSLGGKVLRMNADGTAPTDNPFYGRGDNARFVWTYGHRNVQGLALRPGTGQLWSAEHGPDRDDEVNLIARGGNYGWNPVPGYTESVPMTDLGEFPSARRAVWSSGTPTIAPSGITFLNGPAWGRWQGALAMGLLKGEGIAIITLNPAGQRAGVERLPEADTGKRIRAVQQGPDGALYYTTSDGSGDQIRRLTATAARPLQPYRAGLNVSPVGVAAARTGNTFYLFGNSPGGHVHYRRSTDNGRTWAGWVATGITSTSAPAVASSAPGRIDLVTRSTTGRVVHTWFANGTRAGRADLGGYSTAAPAVASRGDGTLEIFVRGSASSSYGAFRKRYGGGWSGWQPLGGEFTSALGASVNRATGAVTVTGRGRGGGAHARTVTPTSNGSGWPYVGVTLWSARALADTAGGSGLVGVSSGSDSNATVDRGALVMGVPAVYNSAPAVVSRADGTWLMFGRSSNLGAWMYDARPGGYRNVNLGGTLG